VVYTINSPGREFSAPLAKSIDFQCHSLIKDSQELPRQVDRRPFPLAYVCTLPLLSRTASSLLLFRYRLIWSISAIWLGIYVIVQDLNIPLILQPQLFGTLAAVSWVQVSTRWTFYRTTQSLIARLVLILRLETTVENLHNNSSSISLYFCRPRARHDISGQGELTVPLVSSFKV
jgi:hypothetical protein